MATRGTSKPLPPRDPTSPVVKQDKYEQDMDEMKAKLIEMQQQQEEFAARTQRKQEELAAAAQRQQ